jgi:hypothetical protein
MDQKSLWLLKGLLEYVDVVWIEDDHLKFELPGEGPVNEDIRYPFISDEVGPLDETKKWLIDMDIEVVLQFD